MQKELLKPYKFQAEIIDRFKDDPCAGLFLDCGTGKSLITANLIRYKMNLHNEILKTLILCPIIVIPHWKRELLMSTRIPADLIVPVIGSKQKRIRQLSNDKARVFIINYDALMSEEIMFLLLKFGPSIIVADESHNIKSRTTKRYKAVKKLSKDSDYRYALSGTPVTNTAEDLWAQFNFMDNGETFGTRFFTFKNRYFINKNAGWVGGYPDWQFNKSLEPEFKRLLKSKSVSITKEECLDLPDLVEQTIDVPMGREQSRHYTRLKKELITWIDGQEDDPLVVANALTKMLRLSELLSGYMKLESGEIIDMSPNPKLDAFMGLVESTGDHKLIVFCVFKKNYEHIGKALDKAGIKYVSIHGGISAKQKMENVDIFNDMDSGVKVMIANPKSGGVGVNLQSARYAVFYSRTHSVVDFEQARARNYRSGSIDHHHKITHYHLVTSNTVDQDILICLKEKKIFASNLLELKKTLMRS